MPRRCLLVLPLLSLCVLLPAGQLGGQQQDKPVFPGPTDKGFLLPNGWTITPAGKHVPLTDLPLNIVPLPGGKHALVATSGYNKHQLSLIDLTTQTIVDQQTVKQSWFGLAVSAKADTVWWSGGGNGMLHTFSLHDGKLKRTGPEEPVAKGKKKQAAKDGFRSGLCLDAQAGLLYSLNINHGTIQRRGPQDGRGRAGVPLRWPALRRHPGPQPRPTLRLGLGRPRRAGARPTDAARRRQHPRRRPPQPAGDTPTRRPAVRRLRIEELRFGHRHETRHRHGNHLHGAVPEGARGQHA